MNKKGMRVFATLGKTQTCGSLGIRFLGSKLAAFVFYIEQLAYRRMGRYTVSPRRAEWIGASIGSDFDLARRMYEEN